jgi:hypothetical protein
MNAPGATSWSGPSLRHAAQTGRDPFWSINHIRYFYLASALGAHGVSSRQRFGEDQVCASWLSPVLVSV